MALAIIGLLNSGLAAAYYLRLVFTVAQRPDEEDRISPLPVTRVGIGIITALAFATLATLALGIVPGGALHAAETGAHTLQPAPASPFTPAEVTVTRTTP